MKDQDKTKEQLISELAEVNAALRDEIARRKLAEVGLRRRERQLVEAQRIARLGNWEWDIAQNTTIWSDELYHIFGVAPEEFDPNAYEAFLSYIHSEDRERVAAVVEKALSDQVPFSIEYRIVRPDGVVRDIQARGEVIHDEAGRPAMMVGTLQDITERRQMEGALWKSEEKYGKLFHYSNDGIFLHDLEGNIIDVNQKALDQFGYSRAEILSLQVPDLHPPEVLERSKWAFETISRDGFVNIEIDFRKKNGEVFPAEVSSSLFEIAGEKVIQGIVRDVTERKRVENKLQQRSRELALLNQASQAFNSTLDLDQVLVTVLEEVRSLMDVIACSIWLIDLGTDELVCRQATGPKNEIVRGWRLAPGQGIAGWTVHSNRSLIVPDTQADERYFNGVDQQTGLQLRSILSIPLRVKQDVIGVLEVADTRVGRFDREDLALLEPLAASAAIAIENAQLFEQAQQKIIERQQAEEALRESEARYRQSVENSPNQIFSVDEEGTIQTWNQACVQVFQYRSEEIIGQPLHKLLWNLEDYPTIEALLTQVWHGHSLSGQDLVYRSKDGTQRFTISRLYPILDREGGVSGCVFANTDITERRRAEEALRESEVKYRTLFETMAQGVVYQSADGNITSANPAAERTLGLTLDQMQGRTSMDPRWKAIREDGSDFPGDTHPAMEALKTGKEVRNVVMGVFNPRKEDYTWININAVPQFKSGEEEPYQVYTSFEDVTERKRAEEALRESEEKFRNLAEHSPNMVFINKRGRVVYANKRCEEMMGYTTGEFYSADFDFLTLIAPKSRESVKASFGRHMKGKDVEPYEYTLVTKDGRRIEAILTTRLIDYEGERAILGTVTDITERKQAEEALRESEERYRQLFEAESDAIFLIENEGGRILEANNAASALYGYAREELLAKRNTDLSAEPEDTRQVTQETPVIVDQVVTIPLRFHRKKDGTVFPVEITGRFFTWRGRSVHIAAIRDITERRQAEEALRESEEKFRNIVESIPMGMHMYQLEPDGRLVFVGANPAADEILEIDNEQFVGKTIEQAFPALTQTEIPERYRAAASAGEAWQTDQVDYEEGQIKGAFEVHAFQTSPGRMVAAFLDITERKQAEEERERLMVQIQEQAQRVQQIIDTVPEGVLLLDAHEQIVVTNPVAEGHLSLLADVKVGETLTHLGDRPLMELLTSPPKGLWHEVAAGGHSFHVIARSIEARPAPGGWVMVIRDVTQQREIEQRIQQQERLASVGQLAAGIAHDFNNIMATIVLYAQMTARMEELPAVVRKRMETIDQQAQHATNLIQQILDFSRRAMLERRPLDLGLLLREHVKLLKRTLPESIEIELDYEPDECAAPLVINADPTRMQQMVTNLALNARDAMPEGGSLHIGLERIEVKPGESPLLPEMEPGEWIRMTVLDTGTGILPDVLPHIFEPFFTTRAPLGSGLGLAQVHGIVGQHKGRIDVETEVGKGTTFTIYLPVHLVEPSTAASSGGLPALVTGQGETILIVEDDVVVRKALLDSLEGLNYAVLEAANGQEALTLLEQYGDHIALLLSDVVMPGMGGMALLHALRERGLTVPVVMLTGHPLEKELEDLRAQGIIDWLPKPPKLENLAAVMALALKRGTD